MMTKQEVFNKVVLHLRQQGRPSLNANHDCMYRGEDGTKCAIGCLIEDKDYNPDFEGQFFGRFVKDVPNLEWMRKHTVLLEELRIVHDLHQIDYWEMKFQNIAIEHGLEMP